VAATAFFPVLWPPARDNASEQALALVSNQALVYSSPHSAPPVAKPRDLPALTYISELCQARSQGRPRGAKDAHTGKEKGASS
jgi:hypothetical protein